MSKENQEKWQLIEDKFQIPKRIVNVWHWNIHEEWKVFLKKYL